LNNINFKISEINQLIDEANRIKKSHYFTDLLTSFNEIIFNEEHRKYNFKQIYKLNKNILKNLKNEKEFKIFNEILNKKYEETIGDATKLKGIKENYFKVFIFELNKSKI